MNKLLCFLATAVFICVLVVPCLAAEIGFDNMSSAGHRLYHGGMGTVGGETNHVLTQAVMPIYSHT